MNNETIPLSKPGPVKTGLNWVIGSYYLFRQSPSKLLLLAMVYVLLFLVLPALPTPVLIPLLVILIWPSFIALAIGIYREVDQGRDTRIVELAAQIKPHLLKLITLGGIRLAYVILMGWFIQNEFQAISELINQKADPQLIWAQAWPLMLKLSVLIIPIVMATWYSPMLIAYQGMAVGEAIKHSLWASWRNLVALSVAWLGMTLALVLTMLVIGFIVGLIAAMSKTLGGILMTLVLLTAFLLVNSFLLAIKYLSYRHEYYQQPLLETPTPD